jgi:hypothetical protein
MPGFSITKTQIMLCWPRDAKHAVTTLKISQSAHGKSLSFSRLEFQEKLCFQVDKSHFKQTIIKQLWGWKKASSFDFFVVRVNLCVNWVSYFKP